MLVNSYAPVKNCATEGTSAARTTEEQVPDRVSKLLRLRVRAELGVDASTTEGDGDRLALSLAALDGGRQELAVRKTGTREVGLVPGGTNLCFVQQIECLSTHEVGRSYQRYRGPR